MDFRGKILSDSFYIMKQVEDFLTVERARIIEVPISAKVMPQFYETEPDTALFEDLRVPVIKGNGYVSAIKSAWYMFTYNEMVPCFAMPRPLLESIRLDHWSDFDIGKYHVDTTRKIPIDLDNYTTEIWVYPFESRIKFDEYVRKHEEQSC